MKYRKHDHVRSRFTPEWTGRVQKAFPGDTLAGERYLVRLTTGPRAGAELLYHWADIEPVCEKTPPRGGRCPTRSLRCLGAADTCLTAAEWSRHRTLREVAEDWDQNFDQEDVPW